ncbi:MAG: ABC transporter ATP-binding protein [Candidatus Dormibacteraeota bacterium]|nr:ABC transporter ATP-binding protein [Candidatus Dormibacteraeota bacterium]
MAMDSDSVLQTHDLSKRYGRRPAVDRLNLSVRQGEIFGFLGPNGAGKTTTIRMLLGLIRPTAGSVDLFGQDLALNRTRVLPRVGALIEAPALYGYLSGRANLEVLAGPLRGIGRRRIEEVLRTVDLEGRQHDRVRSYSLGMKQRLGVAAAMLNDPDLLILDEPANGLDPAGVVEMRDLLRSLVARGATVFVSSHVLAEVQQLCDRVAIIARGHLVTEAPVADLVRGRGDFEVKVDDPQAVLALLGGTDWGANARSEADLVVTPSPTGVGRDLVRFLVQHDVYPDRVVERTQNLESIFLELTADEGLGGTEAAA